MNRVRLTALLAMVVLLPLPLLAAAPADQPSGQTGATATSAVYLSAAAEIYAWNCAVCHGASGGGLVEAKLAFPADHRDCSRCHRPSNRIVQPLDQPFNDHDMFAIGDPPALHGPAEPLSPEATPTREPMAALVPPEALFAYLSATMPRYDPGRLSEGEYWALTAFLLDLNGRQEEANALALTRSVDRERP